MDIERRMTAMKIIVDGDILLNDDLGDWERKPPSTLAHLIRPGFKPKPWMQAMLVVLADAAVREQPTRIEVNTSSRERWTLSVEKLDGT
jgi:hypothetical protein